MNPNQKQEAALPGAASQVENSNEFYSNSTPDSAFIKADNEALVPAELSKDEFASARARSAQVEQGHRHKQAPLPLKREPRSPIPFPFDALGDLLGKVARRIHEIVKAPDSVCAQSVLAVASLVTQPHANVAIDGREHPLSLFFLTVSLSGDRKSAVDAIVLRPVRDYEKMLNKTHKEEMKSYRNKHEIWKKQREKLLKAAQDDCDVASMEKQLAELGEEPKAPLEPHLIIEEPTYQGLIELFSIGQPSIGLFSDEGGKMLGGYGMKDDNLLHTICGLSSLWDGKAISRVRKSDKNLLLYGRRLALHLMVQETVWSKILKNEQMNGQGIIARCLIAFPETNAGQRPYNDTDVSKDDVIVAFNQRISEILDTPFPLKNLDVGNELNPRPLPLSLNAKKAWIQFHDQIDCLLKPEGRYRCIVRTAGKAAEQCLRIAGVLTLIENVHANEIDADCMEKALQLTRFYLEEMLRIVEVGFIEPDLELAQALLNWMKRKNKETNRDGTFSLREIYKDGGPASIRKRDTALKILKILEEHGAVQRPSKNDREWRLVEE